MKFKIGDKVKTVPEYLSLFNRQAEGIVVDIVGELVVLEEKSGDRLSMHEVWLMRFYKKSQKSRYTLRNLENCTELIVMINGMKLSAVYSKKSDALRGIKRLSTFLRIKFTETGKQETKGKL